MTNSNSKTNNYQINKYINNTFSNLDQSYKENRQAVYAHGDEINDWKGCL